MDSDGRRIRRCVRHLDGRGMGVGGSAGWRQRPLLTCASGSGGRARGLVDVCGDTGA